MATHTGPTNGAGKGDHVSAMTTELPATPNGMPPGIGSGLERQEIGAGQYGAMAARYMARERWDACLDIVTHLTVTVQMPSMSLQSLVGIKVGAVLEAQWPATHDIPLIVEDIFLASVEMEPVGDKLGVRINSFNEPSRPAATPRTDAGAATKGDGNCTLEDIEVTPSLCFGRTNLPMRDVLGFCVGDIIVLDRLVASPVTIEAGGRTVAQGDLVLVDGGYAVRITGVSELRLHLPEEHSAFLG
ncbi:FliM/FliN family flagellar motor switch protein [Granulicella rosea]|nr:FliM/FliN family flagellar motor switch protein [Granulicella rosea]